MEILRINLHARDEFCLETFPFCSLLSSPLLTLTRCHTAKVASSLFYFFHFWHLSRKHVNFSSRFFPPVRRRFGVPGPQSQTPQLLLFRGFVVVVVVVFVVVVCFSNTYTHIQPTRDLIRNRCDALTRVKCDAQLAGISRRLLTAATPPRRAKT